MKADSNQLPNHKAFKPFKWLKHLLAVRRQRQNLARLDEHELADLGLDKPTALAEAQRKVWDVPLFWLK